MPKHKHKSLKRGQRSFSPDENVETETPSADENPPGNDEDEEGVEPIDESDGMDSDMDEDSESIENLNRKSKRLFSQLSQMEEDLNNELGIPAEARETEAAEDRDARRTEEAREARRTAEARDARWTEEAMDTRRVEEARETRRTEDKALAAARGKLWKGSGWGMGVFGQWANASTRDAGNSHTNGNPAGSARTNQDRDCVSRPRPASKFKFKKVNPTLHLRNFNGQACSASQINDRADHDQEENDHNMTVVIDESDDQDEENGNDPSKPGPSHMKPKKRKIFIPQTQASTSSEQTGEPSWHIAQTRQPHEQPDEVGQTAKSRDSPMYVRNEEAGTSQIYQQRRKRKVAVPPSSLPSNSVPPLTLPQSISSSEYKRASEFIQNIQNNERAMDQDNEEVERTREEDVVRINILRARDRDDEDVTNRDMERDGWSGVMDRDDEERERTREDVINRDLERATAEVEQSTRILERREAEQSKRQAEQSRETSRSLIAQTITEAAAAQSMIERRRSSVLKLACKKKEQLTRKNDVKKSMNETPDNGSQIRQQTQASASKPRTMRSTEPPSPEHPPPQAPGADGQHEEASPRSPGPEAAEGNAGDEASEENAAGEDSEVVTGLREELNAITAKYTSLVTMLQAKVECPVCLEVPKRAPIPVCPNGHAICTTCVRLTCPTCRVRMGDGTSLIAVTIIENIPHTCDFQINGCQVVCELADLQLHLKVCPFRTVKCPNFSCNMRVPLSELAEHTLTRCIHTGTYKSSPLVTNYNYVISENHQDGLFDLRRNSTWRPDGIAFDEKNFYLKIMRKARKSLWYFFIQMAGTEEECDQYVATLHVFKPANKVGGKFSNRFVTGVCPIDISSTERAAATGYCSLLPDGIMKQMLKEVAPRVNGNKKFEFSVSVYLQKREDFEKDMENENQPGPSTSRNSEQDNKDKEIKAYQQKLKELDLKIREQDDLIKALRRSEEDLESAGEGQNEEQPEESSEAASEARSGAESPDSNHSLLGNEGRESDNEADVWM